MLLCTYKCNLCLSPKGELISSDHISHLDDGENKEALIVAARPVAAAAPVLFPARLVTWWLHTEAQHMNDNLDPLLRSETSKLQKFPIQGGLLIPWISLAGLKLVDKKGQRTGIGVRLVDITFW